MTRLTAIWLSAPATRAIVDALDGEVFFVGGCVRNALLEQPLTDIDLSTPLRPEEVVRRAEAAGIEAIPTGISHGTITLVHKDRKFEITTFRRDIETDGRRAVVTFSTSMKEDAARRDFTMNALYADARGMVIDPLGGLPDLRARRVRFILDPEQRIREDALRILRFFRFSAWYADAIDSDGLAACTLLADLANTPARERVGAEMLKLLAATDPAPSVASMAASGVLARILPNAQAEALAPLVAREAEAAAPPDSLTRLAALVPAGGDLCLSKAKMREMEEIRRIADKRIAPARAAADFGVKRATQGHLILSSLTQGSWTPIANEIAKGAAAVFPLVARDLIARGIPPGPKLGACLAATRETWIKSDFALDKAALLQRLAV